MFSEPATPHTTWIGIAFRHATPGMNRDRVVSLLTGGPYVHTEVLLSDQEGIVRAYAAYEGLSGFTPSRSFGEQARSKPSTVWSAVRFPFKSDDGFKRVYALVLTLITLALPYNRQDLWQCCFQQALPFESDLDCAAPKTWLRTGVFCSQVVTPKTPCARPLP